jgi:hypothetical protein
MPSGLLHRAERDNVRSRPGDGWPAPGKLHRRISRLVAYLRKCVDLHAARAPRYRRRARLRPTPGRWLLRPADLRFESDRRGRPASANALIRRRWPAFASSSRLLWIRQNAAARLRVTAPITRRSQSSKAIVPTFPEPTIPHRATRRSGSPRDLGDSGVSDSGVGLPVGRVLGVRLSAVGVSCGPV